MQIEFDIKLAGTKCAVESDIGSQRVKGYKGVDPLHSGGAAKKLPYYNSKEFLN